MRYVSWIVGFLWVIVGLPAMGHAAVTWSVVNTAACTADAAPALCCTGNGQGECPLVFSTGQNKTVMATLTGTGTYTATTGDTLAPSTLGMTRIREVICFSKLITVTGIQATPVVSRASGNLTIRLYDGDTGAEISNGTSLTAAAMTCWFLGL